MDDDHCQDSTRCAPASSANAGNLRAALCDLTLLGDDPFLSMQALNLAMVDAWLTPLEEDLLRMLIREDRTPAPEALFVSALSQMWIFAAYELLRAWRQRALDMRKLQRNGGLRAKLAALRKDCGFVHAGRRIRASQIERILDEPGIIDVIDDDLKRTHMPFARLAAIRVSLAKHEVPRKKNSIALNPGYGRINRECGALDNEIEVGGSSLGTINRREIAEGMRALPDAQIPSDDELEAFDALLRGQSVRPAAAATSPG
ncbi:MAG: hypothetical protein F4Z12_09550 [Acidobacteria bacterium]|nr:hypothetical protein [Acidobacteriota bacterium]MYI96319.1 hypothetical protein [Acidobacteriota bacterium]